MATKPPLPSKHSNTTSLTIDEKHTEMISYFDEIENVTIPKLIAEKNRLKATINVLTEKQFDAYLDTRDRVYAIQNEIKRLRSKRKQYLLDNSKYIFHYFEEKQCISTDNTKNQNVNILNSFFKIKAKTLEAENPNSDKYSHSKNAYKSYWRNVTNAITNIQDFVIPTDICEICKEGELISQDEEGILICNNIKCGKFVTYIVDNSKPSNKEPPNEVSYTAYIRLNHFKEILSQFQAKETTQIPPEVIDAIRARIKKERIEDTSKITYNVMRDILRKLGLNKYFEHIQYINSLFGIKPPIMSEELHETLCVLFIEIQKPWAMNCPPDRTNFFNYTYILFQFCTLLDQTKYLPYIPLLKDAEKQREQDQIWKQVCRELDWEFIPSI
jgi:hypothetical protein